MPTMHGKAVEGQNSDDLRIALRRQELRRYRHVRRLVERAIQRDGEPPGRMLRPSVDLAAVRE
jgi:hypothetical protein